MLNSLELAKELKSTYMNLLQIFNEASKILKFLQRRNWWQLLKVSQVAIPVWFPWISAQKSYCHRFYSFNIFLARIIVWSWKLLSKTLKLLCKRPDSTAISPSKYLLLVNPLLSSKSLHHSGKILLSVLVYWWYLFVKITHYLRQNSYLFKNKSVYELIISCNQNVGLVVSLSSHLF